MKNTILIALTILWTFTSLTTFAKDDFTKTSFKVWGNFDMCKKRIEKAAKTDGVFRPWAASSSDRGAWS